MRLSMKFIHLLYIGNGKKTVLKLAKQLKVQMKRKQLIRNEAATIKMLSSSLHTSSSVIFSLIPHA